MFKSAYLKAREAAKRIDELYVLIRETPPFTYVVETNTQTRQRATFAKRNEAVADDISVKLGGIFHELRSAIDHAYWEIVSPFATTPKEERAIQFPFSVTAHRLDEAISNRLGPRVGPEFVDAIKRLRPHGEPGGNELLYLIHEVNGTDKHRTLTPLGDYTRLSGEMVRRQIPDFPVGLHNISFAGCQRDIVWSLPHGVRIRPKVPGLPEPTKHEEELDVPVDVVFRVGANGNLRPVIPTLYALVDVAKKTIKVMEPFAPP